MQIHADLLCSLWLHQRVCVCVKRFMGDVKEWLCELCTTQSERIHVWLQSLHVFLMRITGRPEGTCDLRCKYVTMGSICWQKNKLVLANKSKILKQLPERQLVCCLWFSVRILCLRFQSHFYTTKAATNYYLFQLIVQEAGKRWFSFGRSVYDYLRCLRVK